VEIEKAANWSPWGAIMLMLGQKIQIGVIFLVLAVAGYLFFRNSKQTFDYSVNSWIVYRHFGNDKTKIITPTNPEDPKKLQLVNIFACADGQLEIIEYPKADPARQPTLNPKLERRGPPRQYKYLLDPFAPIETFTDPFKHALALATYHQVYDKSLNLLSGVNLTPEQSAKEVEARNLLNAVVNKTENAMQNGTFHADLLDKIMKALTAYNGAKGDPEKDANKAELARKVLEAASDYIQKGQQEKDAAIDMYMKALEGILTPAQQSKLVEAANQWEQQNNSHAVKPAATRRGPTSAPAPGRNRGRGPSTTRGNGANGN
jgi:hypothetical protein